MSTAAYSQNLNPEFEKGDQIMTIRLTMLAAVMALLTACASTETGDQPKKEKPDYVKMAQNMGYAGLKRTTRITNYRTQKIGRAHV